LIWYTLLAVDIEGKMIEFMLNLKKEGYSEATIISNGKTLKARCASMITCVLAGVGMSTITGLGPVIVVEALSFFRQALSSEPEFQPENFGLRTRLPEISWESIAGASLYTGP